MKENGAIKFAVSRYVLTIGVFVAMVAFGFIAALGIGVDRLPSFDLPTVSVSTTYQGATPDNIEQQVTRVIEDAVSTIAGVQEISSTSSSGNSQITISFASGTNTNSAANEVSQKVSSIRNRLPADADAPVVQKLDPNAQPIMSVTLSGGGADLRQMYEFADQTVKNRLERVEGVAQVNISGAPQRQIEVLLDPAKLASYNLSPSRVTQAISSSSQDLPAGNVTTQGTQISFATRNTPTSLTQIEQILVDGSKGIRVADLGVVRDGSKDTFSYTRLNGEPVVLLSIRKTSGTNTTSVAAGVRSAMAAMSLPKGYTYTITGDTSSSITASVNDTIKEALIVAVAVAVVCLIALGRLNTAFAVVLAIPIALSFMPIVFTYFGYTFNIITLLAMIVAMGIVVDDSIVVAENIERYRAMGYGMIESVLKGATEVISAASAATFSLVGVLIPLGFIPGIIGDFFGAFALGLAGAIFFSWLEALFFLTVRMAYTPDPEPVSWAAVGTAARNVVGNLRWAWATVRRPLGIGLWVVWAIIQVFPVLTSSPGAAAAVAAPLGIRIAIAAVLILLFPLILAVLRYVFVLLWDALNALTVSLHAGSEHLLGRFREWYGNLLYKGLGRTGWILAAAVAFFITGIFAVTRLNFTFTPSSDESQATVTVKLAPGSSLAQTNAVAREIETFLRAQPEVKEISTTVGASAGFVANATESNRATIAMDLVPLTQRENVFVWVPEIQAQLRAKFASRPDIEIRATANANGPGGTDGLTFQLTAPTQKQLEQAGEKIVAELRLDPDVLSINSSLTETTPERVYVPDQTRLAGTGLTPQDLANIIRTANSGSKGGDFLDGEERYDITVRLDRNLITDENSFLSLPVYTSALQTNLTLRDLGSFEMRQAPSTLFRFNKRASASLDIKLKPGVSSFSKQRSIPTDLEAKGILNEDVTLGVSGFGAAGLTNSLLVYGPLALLIAIMLNYLVLGAQFNSWRYPIYLLLPVPLAVVGGVWALFFFGAPLDVITILGMVVLVGLSTKNSILLLDFVVHEAQKLPLREALVSAAKLRLRPIIMTTLTVLVISFPLIFGGGEGAEFRRGLGIVILGGILTSAILTLFVVPSAFYRFEKKYFEKRAMAPAPTPIPTAASVATD